jgi:glutathione S-transferase
VRQDHERTLREIAISQSNNPRYWASQWYSTKFAREPWPGGWYWHDEQYNWYGPYDSEHEARRDLRKYEGVGLEASEHAGHFELYYHPLSPYSQKVLIAIYEKGLEFTPRIVNLKSAQERAHYRELYPMGKLPLIVLNHGPLIPESSIIIEYLDGLGGSRLIPEDAEDARRTRFMDRFFDSYLTDSASALFAEGIKPPAQQDTRRIESAQYSIRAVYDFIEHEVSHRPWAAGQDFSMADCAAAAGLFYASRILPYDDHPNLAVFAERLATRPSVARVREEAAPYMNAYLTRIKELRETA